MARSGPRTGRTCRKLSERWEGRSCFSWDLWTTQGLQVYFDWLWWQGDSRPGADGRPRRAVVETDLLRGAIGLLLLFVFVNKETPEAG